MAEKAVRRTVATTFSQVLTKATCHFVSITETQLSNQTHAKPYYVHYVLLRVQTLGTGQKFANVRSKPTAACSASVKYDICFKTEIHSINAAYNLCE